MKRLTISRISRIGRMGLMGVAAAAATAACQPKDPYAGPLQIMPPIGTQDGLVYIDRTHDELIFVEPGDGSVTVSRQALDEADAQVAWRAPTRNGADVLVLTVPDNDKVENVGETLWRFNANAPDNPVEYDVRAPFNALALSPDHRRAVLYFDGNDPSSPLQNANQVAIVDLNTRNIRNLTLNGFGGRLSSVHFPGQIEEGVPVKVQVGSFARDIAAFLTDDEVVLVDMDDPDAVNNQVAVNFESDPFFVPNATLMRPGDDLFADPSLFIRSVQGGNVAMLTLVEKEDEVTGAPGFTVQISLLPVGVGVTDFVFYNGEAPYLVTLGQGSQLVFTDIRTQEGFEIDLEGSARQMFLRDHDIGSDQTVRQIVAWASGGTTLHTLDLDGIENTLGRKPHRLKIETGVGDLVQLDNDRVLVGSENNLYVVDFPGDQVTPLTSQVPYDAQSSALDGNTLLLGTPGQLWLSAVDLHTLNPESMLLDDSIQSFHHATATGKVMITHGDPIGHLTVADANDPSRSTSYVEWGFLVEGVFDPK